MNDMGATDELVLKARIEEADRRMADADALLEIASAQLSVAARNIADAHTAEREYRRATWHYTRLMRHRLATPLETIAGMADTLRDMPDLEHARRVTMAEAIGQQARSLREECLREEDQIDAPTVTRPSPLTDAIRAIGPRRASDEVDDDRPMPEPPNLGRFRQARDSDRRTPS